MKEFQKVLIAISICTVLYFAFCKCFEKFDPSDPFYKPYSSVNSNRGANKHAKKLMNTSHIKANGNGCNAKDAMFVSSDLLPKEQKTGENYFEGLNVPIDASNIELPLERQFYSTGNLRNANVGLRSEPPNPQKVVSPWLNTTITPLDDNMRRPLDGEYVDTSNNDV